MLNQTPLTEYVFLGSVRPQAPTVSVLISSCLQLPASSSFPDSLSGGFYPANQINLFLQVSKTVSECLLRHTCIWVYIFF